jgi:hypothetical protein
MGAIYTASSRVAAVLSSSCSVVLEQIRERGCVDPGTLLVLDDDDWVTRAWTYQEMVNGKDIQFIAERNSGVAVGAQEFLNSIGEAIEGSRRIISTR